jgi:hypothetical protein
MRSWVPRTLAEGVPNRPPKPDDLEGFRAYIDARADMAERQAAYEAASLEDKQAHRAEGRMLRLLIWMILLIVVGGFIVSFIGLMILGPSAIYYQ